MNKPAETSEIIEHYSKQFETDCSDREIRSLAYSRLVSEKRACRACMPDLSNPACYAGKDYDQGQIGLWTRWQGGLDAPIMVVGQDWGGVDTLVDNQGWEMDPFPANTALRTLLAAAGIEVGEPPLKRTQGPVPQKQAAFFTNAVLCLKKGGASDKLNDGSVQRCSKFLQRTIGIVKPKIVVTLGKLAFLSVRTSYASILPPDVQKITSMKEAADLQNNPPEIFPGTRLFPAYHCGYFGQLERYGRPLPKQIADWQKLRQWLA